MRQIIITIVVNIPALSDLVKYLRERDNTQAQVDALAAQVSELTKGLHQSSDNLETSVDQNS